MLELTHCPGTLKAGYATYSSTALRRVFNGRLVSHILPYDCPASNAKTDAIYTRNRRRLSISGVQEKFSVVLDKNKLRLTEEGERGTYILKPIPGAGIRSDQMPANEHLSMQLARQLFGIETAENALIFFQNGAPAYLTKRFDVQDDGSKWAQEDFATLAGRTPQTHGKDFKYLGNYLDLFRLMQIHVPAYAVEAPKLFRLILFNYLISNGDAHLKNFSLLETPMGDFKLSPAYDLLNSSIHIQDSPFALSEGLLPKSEDKGKVAQRFRVLGERAGIAKQQLDGIFEDLISKEEEVVALIDVSYLNAKTKRNYRQAYQRRLNKLLRA
ncbi:MAG: type II toxin-antitoxin system HipA family toxin [Bacteroidetes bacterium]|nr:type II toxin-antitoxin system HipA family toxin [Bacteroidota bacterium]